MTSLELKQLRSGDPIFSNHQSTNGKPIRKIFLRSQLWSIEKHLKDWEVTEEKAGEIQGLYLEEKGDG